MYLLIEIDIYGTPGTGKTYLAHNILVGLDLIQSTTWVNCLTLQSSNKEFNLVRRILVLDEFDQASFIDFNAMTRLMHMNFCRIILIANEHRCSLSEEYIRRSFNAVVV